MVGTGPGTNCLNFGEDPDHRLDPGPIFTWYTLTVENCNNCEAPQDGAACRKAIGIGDDTAPLRPWLLVPARPIDVPRHPLSEQQQKYDISLVWVADCLIPSSNGDLPSHHCHLTVER